MTSNNPSPPADHGLPPANATAGRLLTIPGVVVKRYAVNDVLADAVAAIGPNAIIPVAPHPSVVRPQLARVVDQPLCRPGGGIGLTSETLGSGVTVVAPSTPQALPEQPAAVPHTQSSESSGNQQWYLLTDALSLSVDPHRRQTTLNGLEAYQAQLPAGWIDKTVSHLATTLPTGYTATVDTDVDDPLVIHGIGQSNGIRGVGSDEQRTQLIQVDCFEDGTVQTTAVRPDRFGMRGLDGVSATRAKRLRQAGFDSREVIADATPRELAAVESIGRQTAQQLRASARAIAEQTVVPTGDGAVPSGEPVFIDIETDGLAGTTVWLIGVLDGNADDGRYLAFRQRHPDRPAEPIEAFMTWLTGSARGRPLVAWNGYRFDFEILSEQIRRLCPTYEDAWERRYQFDPLYWAATQGNAALPGRTNTLERVGKALGWEPSITGIDGAVVAEIYTTWRRQVQAATAPTAVSAPDWDRLEAYCEDDVRALATIYEALIAAARGADDSQPRQPTGADSTQGSLSEFT